MDAAVEEGTLIIGIKITFQNDDDGDDDDDNTKKLDPPATYLAPIHQRGNLSRLNNSWSILLLETLWKLTWWHGGKRGGRKAASPFSSG